MCIHIFGYTVFFEYSWDVCEWGYDTFVDVPVISLGYFFIYWFPS